MEYTVVRTDRKTVALQINSDGELTVRVPKRFPDRKIKKIIEEHRDWIEKKTAQMVEKKLARPKLSQEQIYEFKVKAREQLPPMTEHFAEIMGVSYNSVKITSAQKRFGSCSAKNNICFSYILMQYPKEAVEYVVVHELAHTVHHNHSRDFYRLIERYMPDYKDREKMLKS